MPQRQWLPASSCDSNFASTIPGGWVPYCESLQATVVESDSHTARMCTKIQALKPSMSVRVEKSIVAFMAVVQIELNTLLASHRPHRLCVLLKLPITS
jgi:hypothetical protein